MASEDPVAREDRASWCTKLFYLDFSKLLNIASKRQLQVDDVGPPPQHMRSNALLKRFQAGWDAASDKQRAKGSSAATRKALWSAVRGDALVFLVTSTVALLVPFANPFLLEAILDSLAVTGPGQSQAITNGIIYAVCLFGVTLIIVLLDAIQLRFMYRAAVSSVSSLVTAMYSHTLRLSNSARAGSSTGEVLNYLASDTHAVFQSFGVIRWLWATPIIVVACLVLLFRQVGHATWGGLAVMILSIPINGKISSRYGAIYVKKVAQVDKRLKIMTDVLNAIKLVKFYAWEQSFLRRVAVVRAAEMVLIRAYNLTTAALMLSIGTVPVIVAVVTFSLYVAISDEPVTVSKFFVTLSLLELIRFPLFAVPLSIALTASALISLRRIQAFLMLPTMDPNDDPRQHPEVVPDGDSIAIKGGEFQWSHGDEAEAEAGKAQAQGPAPAPASAPAPAGDNGDAGSVTSQAEGDESRGKLSGVDLTVRKGELFVIVGPVGSGKSSLLSAMLGEMPRVAGSVGVVGRVGLVPQQAFILNATLRANIVMDRPWDEERYNRVLDACCLRPDLAMLPAGDATEIGERGLNLSGGQMARVSLARAVYDDADVLLLDDILAAVDAHVGRALLQQVVLGELKSRTRVLVTNQLKLVLHHADTVVLMSQGRIAEKGTYAELSARSDGEFRRLMQEFGGAADHDATDGGAHDGEVGAAAGAGAGAGAGAAAVVGGAGKQDSDGAAAAVARKQSVEVAADTAATAAADGTLVSTEARSKGAVSSVVYKRILAAAGPGFVVAYVLLLVISNVANLGSTFWLSVWADPGRFFSNPDSLTTGFFVGVYVGWTVLAALLVYAKEVVFAFAAKRAAGRLHDALLCRVLGAPMAWFDVTPLGRVINRFSKDVQVVDGDLPYYINHVCTASAVAIVMMVLSVVSTVWLTPIAAVGLYIYYRLQATYRRGARDLQRLDNTTRSPVFAFISESMAGLTSVRVFNWARFFSDTNRRQVDTNMSIFYATKTTTGWMSVRSNIIGGLVSVAVSIFVVYMARPGGFLPLSVGALAISLSLGLTASLGAVTFLVGEMDTRMTSLERVVEYTDAVPVEEEVIRPNKARPAAAAATTAPTAAPASPKASAVAPSSHPTGRSRSRSASDSFAAISSIHKPLEAGFVKGWQAGGTLKLTKVAMRYRPGLPLVLRDVSFEVAKAGEKVAICGRTGSGKSSLINTILQMRPLAGGIIEMGGRDVTELPLAQLRGAVSMIPQDPMLFDGTLRFNLDPFGVHKDARLHEVLRLVRLMRPEGGGDGSSAHQTKTEFSLEMDIKEGGKNVSLGQRQLLCIARALLRNSSIILMDEATASVDPESDALIQAMIRTEFKHATVLTIAHRIDTIIDYDRVIVMDDGRVAELGTPKELMSMPNGQFASLVAAARNAEKS